jgi:alkylhydroperoxidase/carboxymuconolactone decarboxylase family protein YurZ
MDFLAMFEQTRFVSFELVGETGFNSSPVTRGALFRARKRGLEGRLTVPQNPMETYDQFFSQAYAPGTMDDKTKHLIALAASLGAGCQP